MEWDDINEGQESVETEVWEQEVDLGLLTRDQLDDLVNGLGE